MSDETITISCGEELNIAAVAHLKSEFLSAVKPAVPIMLDPEPLVRVDGAGIQLLCSLFVDAAQRGYSVRWKANSQVLQRAARLLGVEQLLQLDVH